jgi:hypothetical protein
MNHITSVQCHHLTGKGMVHAARECIHHEYTGLGLFLTRAQLMQVNGPSTDKPGG